jgi:hypothetical protein
VLRAFADWGVINDSAKKGEYCPTQPVPVVDLDVAAWFLETAAVSRDGSASDFQTLVDGPCLFPFRIDKVSPERLAKSGRLEVLRHGMEETLVQLRPTRNYARR